MRNLLIILLLSPFFAVAQNNALLWEITGKGLKKPSYLFGTMHLEDKRAFNFNDSLLLKLEASDALFVEMTNEDVQASYQKLAFNPDGKKISKQLNAADRKLLDEALQSTVGIQLETMDNARPLVLCAAMLEASSKKDMPDFLDSWLQSFAQSKGKQVESLEKVEDYESALDLFTVPMLMDYVKNRKKHEALTEQLIGFYEKEDLGGLLKLMLADEVYKNMVVGLLDDRNKKMAPRIAKLVRQKSIFVAVGAGHLPGENGLIELLRRHGFFLRPVKAPKSGLPLPDFTKADWQTFTAGDGSFSVQIPGEPKVQNLETPLEGGGKVDIYFFMHESGDEDTDNVLYGGGYTDYPPELGISSENSEEEVRKTLDGSRDGAIERSGGTFVSEKDIRVDGYLGREFVAEFAEGTALMYMRFWLVGSRAYFLQVASTKAAAGNPKIQAYFDSFKMLKK